jgi:hypothetical protein
MAPAPGAAVPLVTLRFFLVSEAPAGYAYWPTEASLGDAPWVKAVFASPFAGNFGQIGNDYHMAANGACAVHFAYVHPIDPADTSSGGVWYRRVIYCEPDPYCYVNCDNSTTPPIVNTGDFTCFLQQYAAAQELPSDQQVTHYANCDHSTNAPAVNTGDFTCFIQKYAAGCG